MSTYLKLREKQIGIALVILTAIAYTYVWFKPVFLHEKTASGHPVLYFLGGLAIMAIDIYAILKLRRMIVGGVSMIIAFFAWGQFIVFPFPLLAYGAFTAFKRDPEEMARRRAAVQARRDGRSSGSSTKRAPVIDSTGRVIPVASKRYTPPTNARQRGRRSK